MSDFPKDTGITISIIVTSLLSFSTCGIVIIEFWTNKKFKDGNYCYITQICFCDFCYSFIYFLISVINLNINTEINDILCDIEGFLRTFFELSSFFWTSVIVYMLHLQTINSIYVENPLLNDHLFWTFLCYGLSLILSIMQIVQIQFFQSSPLPLGQYQNVSPLQNVNCIISNDHLNNFSMVQIWCFQIPYFLVIILNFIIISKSIKQIRNSTEIEGKDLNPLFVQYAIPLILFFTWIWVFINRIIISFGDQSKILDYIEYPLICLTGFFDALLYARVAMSESCIKIKYFCFPCCRQDNPDTGLYSSLEII